MSDETPTQARDVGAGARALAELLEAVVSGFGRSGRIVVGADEEGGLAATIEGEGLSALVGREGQVLDAIQHLAAQAASRAEGARQRVFLDVDGYRGRRADELQRLAERAAAEALEHGEEIELDAMSPYDRRLVHLALHERTDVVTRSEGEEPRRRIIVEPAD